ncbi:MAG: pyrroline-5-carboxylate reductase [Gammaproteobacteria bacterium]|nr:pyrroline-5-carboxylate reductase [Gammaproteobacteria bacterium]
MDLDTVGFIGGGNMTRAIAGGLLDDGYAAEKIAIAEPVEAQRVSLQEALPGVFVSSDNAAVVAQSECVVLSVKPQIIAAVCRDLADAVQASNPLVISIAAGPRIDDIDSWLGGNIAVVRVMPNQPALLGKGISGMFGNRATSSQQLSAATDILAAVGPVVNVSNEALIDAVTAVSGSGPAYFYLLIDMLAKTGKQLGLDEDAALKLAAETAFGASTLARDSGESMDELIARVRSPGGTTAAALDSLEDQGVRDIFNNALTAARDRATKLADQAHQSGKDE